MDKNTIIGFILIAALLIGFGYWNQPSAEQIAEQARQDSIAAAQKVAKEQEKKREEAKSVTAFKDTLNGNNAAADSINALPEALTTLQNKNIAVSITNKGGFVKKAVVKGYESLKGEPNVTVFEGDEQTLDFRMAGKDMNIITKQLTFVPVDATDSSVVMQANIGNAGKLNIAYTLPHDSYLLQISLKAEGVEGLFSPNCNKLSIDWRDHCRQQEKSFSFENRYTSLTYKEAGAGTDYLNEGKEVEEEVEEPLDWVAYKTQFFSVVLIAEKQFAKNSTQKSVPEEKGGGYLKQFSSQMETNFDPTGAEPTRFEMYVGPNNFRLLQKVSDQTSFDKKLELQDLI
ncbi:MAG: membrane protein insertase YidC, partial [Prevotellaceae bacterium]|nr:membrane protein insertase YidC [Prevotellaceae bacterium]